MEQKGNKLKKFVKLLNDSDCKGRRRRRKFKDAAALCYHQHQSQKLYTSRAKYRRLFAIEFESASSFVCLQKSKRLMRNIFLNGLSYEQWRKEIQCYVECEWQLEKLFGSIAVKYQRYYQRKVHLFPSQKFIVSKRKTFPRLLHSCITNFIKAYLYPFHRSA